MGYHEVNPTKNYPQDHQRLLRVLKSIQNSWCIIRGFHGLPLPWNHLCYGPLMLTTSLVPVSMVLSSLFKIYNTIPCYIPYIPYIPHYTWTEICYMLSVVASNHQHLPLRSRWNTLARSTDLDTRAVVAVCQRWCVGSAYSKIKSDI